jgi:hypothetical protein
VTYFDPAAGTSEPDDGFTVGRSGAIRRRAPRHGHDWVLVIEPEGKP